MTPLPRVQGLAATLLLALITLCIAWELWLAPLRPGGSWVVLKTLPLLLIVPGVFRGNIYTYRLSTMLVLAYFVEGVVRGYADRGTSQWLAWGEAALALAYFTACIVCVRQKRGAVMQPG